MPGMAIAEVLVIVPSGAIDTMILGELSGMVAMAKPNLPKKHENK